MTVLPETRLRSLVLGALLALGLGLATLFPDALGLRTLTGAVHLSALRALVTLAALGVLLAAAVGLLAGRARPFLTGFLGFGAVLVLASGGILLDRGYEDAGAPAESRTPAPAAVAGSAPGSTLTVLTANVLIDNTDYDAVLREAAAAHADVIALQETSPAIVEAVLERTGLSAEYDIAAVSIRSGVDTAATILLVRPALEPEEIDGGPLPFATAGARTTAGDVYAVHTYAPIDRGIRQFNWWRSVSESAKLCTAGAGTLVVGDFNATPDHRTLTGHTDCTDAATALGMGAVGTWPQTVGGRQWPRGLGAAIDHQLFDPRTFTAQHGRILDVPGSDHRGVLVEYAVDAARVP